MSCLDPSFCTIRSIGKDVAMEFARLGAHVTLLARTEAKLKDALEEIKAVAVNKDAQKLNYVVADVTDYEA